MQANKQHNVTGEVLRFNSKLTAENSFRIFLSNLYYKLDGSDAAFYEMLTNKNSGIVYLEYSTQFGKVLVDARTIETRIKAYKGSLQFQDINRLFHDFLKKNNINTKQKAV